jgi:hypothetical protein
LWTLVDDTEKESASGVVFQQDSTSPYFNPQARLVLNAGFPNRRTARCGSITSPDLTLDFL